jgi:SAM-dependent methyltransferase
MDTYYNFLFQKYEKKTQRFNEPLTDLTIDFFSGNTGSLIDVGCGFGNFSKRFIQTGYEVTGTDINTDLVEKNKQDLPQGTFIVNNIDDGLPLEDSSFQYVFSNSVLQYVDWKRAMSEYCRILKPNGQAVFIENLDGNPFAKIYRISKKVIGYGPFLTPRKHMKFKELVYLEKRFENVDLDFHTLLAPISYLVPFILKKDVNTPGWLECKLDKLDSFLINKFPFLKRYCSRVIIKVSGVKK